jgi:hypothetical protein
MLFVFKARVREAPTPQPTTTRDASIAATTYPKFLPLISPPSLTVARICMLHPRRFPSITGLHLLIVKKGMGIG